MAVTIARVTVPASAGALAGENMDRTLSAEAAETLWVLPDGFFLVAELMAFTFLAATALAILRTKAFPTWFGWVTALAAVVLLILPIGWAMLKWGRAALDGAREHLVLPHPEEACARAGVTAARV